MTRMVQATKQALSGEKWRWITPLILTLNIFMLGAIIRHQYHIEDRLFKELNAFTIRFERSLEKMQLLIHDHLNEKTIHYPLKVRVDDLDRRVQSLEKRLNGQ